MPTASPATEPNSAPNSPRSEAEAGPGVGPGGGAWSHWLVALAGLVWTLVRTDFKVRYHGTLGGFGWALVKPLVMFVLLMSVFSFLFASNPDYKLNLIIGLFLWDFFAEGTKSGILSLYAKGFLLTKTRFPAWVLVVTSISNAVIALAVFGAVMIAFLSTFGHPPTLHGLAWFGVYVLALALIVIGFSLAASVLFLRYRDLNQIWDLMVQAGFFVAPIIYPIGILPEKYHFYLYVWPPTPIVEFSRQVLVQGTVPSATANVYLAFVVGFCLAIGVITFRWFGPRAVEHL